MNLEQFVAHKKAVNLAFWAELRESRGEAYSIDDRIKFNWPSLTPEETDQIIEAYKQRRTEMAKKRKTRRDPPENAMTQGQRPSSPKRPPKYHIRCEYGVNPDNVRLYTETFISPDDARTFLDLILKPNEEPFKWVNKTTVATKGGVLTVSCEELEDLMEHDKRSPQLPENIILQIAAFLRGKWETKKRDTNATHTRVPSVSQQRRRVPAATDPNIVTIQDICTKNKWEPRVARAKMRDAKWTTPDGGWRWPKKDEASIEKKLKELMK